jgi:hypothetical protein
MSGLWLLILLGLAGLIDAGIGLSVLRRAQTDQAAPPPRPNAGQGDPSLIGRVMLFSALLFWIAAALLSFGIVPISGIEPIRL